MADVKITIWHVGLLLRDDFIAKAQLLIVQNAKAIGFPIGAAHHAFRLSDRPVCYFAFKLRS